MSDVPIEVVRKFSTFPPAQQRALESTWERATSLLPGANQCIAWQMPSLRIDGELVLSMSGFGEHNSIFPGSGVIEALVGTLAGYTVTKGTIHFDRDRPMNARVVKAIIAARVDEINASFPRTNGQFKEFYANGRLKATGKVKSEELNGNWRWFRVDGTIKRSGQFRQGRRVGTWITYDAAGAPYKETSFD